MLNFIVGNSELAQRIRAHSWEDTELGPPETWPESLKTLVSVMLAANQQMYVVWGQSRILLYNDRYIEVLQGHHPSALGRPFLEVWSEIADDLRPLVENAYAGKPTYQDDITLILERRGFSEETHFAYSYTPVLGPDGGVEGFFCPCIETTEQVKTETALRESEERQAFLLELSDALRNIDDAEQIQQRAIGSLGEYYDAANANCAVIEVQDDVNYYDVRGSYAAPGRQALKARYPSTAFPGVTEVLRRGETLAVSDVASDPRLRPEDKSNYAVNDIGNFLMSPLVKGGRLRAILAVHGPGRHPWTPGDVALIEEVGERSWAAVERARAEAALRESEERRSLALEATRVGTFVWHVQEDRGEPDARMLALFGQPLDGTLTLRDAIASMIHPDDAQRYADAVAEATRPEGSRELREDIRVRHGEEWRWVAVTARISFDENDRPLRMAGTGLDVTERKRAELALRESEERQAFLLKLSDALRPLTGTDEIQRVAGRLAAEHWGMTKANYVRIETRHGVPYAIVRDSYAIENQESVDGDYPLADFPAFTGRMLAGEKMMVPEVASDPNLTELDKANWNAMNIATLLSVSLVKGGRLVACFAVHGPKPRAWTMADAQLLEEIAERTWAAVARAGAEAALTDSEARLQMLMQGIPQLVWRAVDGGHWTWASPQWADFTGQSVGESHELGWLDPVHPDDRERVREVWAGATRRGEFHADYRIKKASDGLYRWFQSRATPVRAGGDVIEWLGTSTDVDDLRALQNRQQVLVAELQHRVRNILTVVRSVFSRSVESGAPIDEVADHFRGRLDSLARTQVLVTQSSTGLVDLENLILDELLSVGAADSPAVTIEGPDVMLSSKAAESIGLAIHELTTNAVKYGALRSPSGQLEIRWDVKLDYGEDRRLVLRWTEQGVPAISLTPARYGFGRELIEEALPYRLGAETELSFLGGGVSCTISLPLPEEGASAVDVVKEP